MAIIVSEKLIYKKFPHFASAIKQKLKRGTSENRSRLIRTPSYEIDQHDSIIDLVNTNDYTLQNRNDIVPISVVDTCNT